MKVNPMIAFFAMAYFFLYMIDTATANPLQPTNQVGQMVDMIFKTFWTPSVDRSARALGLEGDDVLKVKILFF